MLAGVALTAAAASYGLSVFDRLSNGGYGDPRSPSQQAFNQLKTTFKDQRSDLLILITAETGTITSDGDRLNRIQNDLKTVSETPGVTKVTSYFSTGAPTLVSTDSKQTLASVVLDGNQAKQTTTYQRIAAKLHSHDGLQIAYGGYVAINDQISTQIEKDVTKAEILSFAI